MKSGLHLRMSQHFALTPQLQQSIKLLQLSTVDLNQEIEKTLADNIFIERVEEDATVEKAASPLTADRHDETYVAQTGNDRSSTRSRHDGEDYDFLQSRFPDSPSLRDHLSQQLNVLHLSIRDRQLGQLVIDALDDNGYLPHSLDEILEWLPAQLEIALEELKTALKWVQSLEPAGVGARSVQECLLRQLDALSVSAERTLAVALVTDHLDALAAHDFGSIKRVLGCDNETLRTAYRLIKSLNPKPGSVFGKDETRYIAPDVIARKTAKGWIAELNHKVIPQLRINHSYVDAVKASSDNARFSAQIQEARWMVKNIQQRLNTIQRVSQAIVERQYNFFEHGEIAMRPLVLREIAETVNLHESTVSRVTTQKYILTPRGTFELKYFFGSHVATDTGGACSATAIRAMIKQLVSSENAHKPISDNEISKILGDQGIVVARRTVAKYREAMNIEAINMRRSL